MSVEKVLSGKERKIQIFDNFSFLWTICALFLPEPKRKAWAGDDGQLGLLPSSDPKRRMHCAGQFNLRSEYVFLY